jgi:hypothetical protein
VGRRSRRLTAGHRRGQRPARFDLGIIAGNQSINPILSTALPGPDDGKVPAAGTRVEGMHDHVEMPVSHMFLMRDDDVIAQVLFYLRNGVFERSALNAPAVGDAADMPPHGPR